MNFTPVKPGAVFAAGTLKGKALTAAADAGMIPQTPAADGYNIAPFLKFWDAFSPALKQALREAEERGQQSGGVFGQKRNQRPGE